MSGPNDIPTIQLHLVEMKSMSNGSPGFGLQCSCGWRTIESHNWGDREAFAKIRALEHQMKGLQGIKDALDKDTEAYMKRDGYSWPFEARKGDYYYREPENAKEQAAPAAGSRRP